MTWRSVYENLVKIIISEQVHQVAIKLAIDVKRVFTLKLVFFNIKMLTNKSSNNCMACL